MGQILVRQLKDETIAALKERAKANNRSTEAEVRSIIEAEIVPKRAIQPDRKLTDFLTDPPTGRTQDEIDAYVRQLRDEWDDRSAANRS